MVKAETQTHKIDKGVPMPPPLRTGKYRGLVEAMRPMEVGDSMALPFVSKGTPHANVRSAAKTLGFRITIRKTSETEIRFWRIA